MIANIVFFLIGIQLCIELLASFYRYIDLWYCIDDYWPRITLRLAAFVALQAAFVWLLPSEWLTALLWGELTYLAIYVGKFLLLRMLVLILELVRS